MPKRLYVGNLPFSATEESVRAAFSAHGEVLNVAMIMDRETGRPRGFGFVEMDDAGADVAVVAMNGAEFGGRTLRVNEAQPRPEGGGGFRERRPRRNQDDM
ncbi:RNA-binding protein [bacterium]|nr:RNA-binding protein [bacterium]